MNPISSSSSPCPHTWVAETDPAEEAACYRDGFDYYPSYRVCSRCGARQKIQYGEPTPLLERIKAIPITLFGMLAALLFFAFLPLIIIIGAILSDLNSKKRTDPIQKTLPQMHTDKERINTDIFYLRSSANIRVRAVRLYSTALCAHLR